MLHGLNGCGIPSVKVALSHCVWHGLAACGVASLGVAWLHVDDMASGFWHGVKIVSVGVYISQRM